ncbi:MAG: hypothetical protein ACR2FM_02845 [Candidatus Saccharimonadales bacterium]
MNNLEIIGLALWWAEGSKSRRDKRWKNAVSYPIEITNTDHRIIKIFLKYMIQEMKIDPRRFKLQLQIHEGDDQAQLEKYWSEVTNIPKKRFNKTIVRPLGNKSGKSKGTCKVRFSDKMVYNSLQQQLNLLLESIPGCGAVG